MSDLNSDGGDSILEKEGVFKGFVFIVDYCGKRYTGSFLLVVFEFFFEFCFAIFKKV